MANKKKPENGEDLIRQYLKDKAAGRSTFDEKSDFQKRVRSGENFGKPHDFGQSEKQKPSVPKKPITDNKRRDLQSTLNEQREEQQRAQRKAETDALASKKEERDSLKKEADNYYKEAAKKSSEAGFQHVGIKYTGVNHNKIKQLSDEAKALRDEGNKKQEEYKAKDWEYRNANLAEQQKQVGNQTAAYGNYSANINKKESDPKYRAVNGIISGSKIVGGGNANSVASNAQIYKDMTDAERNTYNFLYEKQGKDVANNYLKILEYDLANRYVNRRTADAQAFVGNGKGAANTANSIFGSLASIYEPAVADTTGYLSLTAKKGLQALGLDDDLPINYQKDYSSGAWGNALRGQVSQNIENDGKDLFTVGDYTFNTGKAGSFLYNNAMSIYENVVRNSAAPVLGVGGTAFLMGSQVAGSAAKDALDRGATEDQAIAYGALNGVGETLFEKISLEHLLKIKDPKTAIGRIGNILKQSGVEASEEAATSVWNMLVSSQALGELSDYNLAKEEYVRQGLSEKEAEKRASLDSWMGVLKDAFAGALSGGVMSGVQMFKNNRQMRRANSQIFAKDGAMTGQLADLIEYGGSLRGEAINSETAKTMAEAMGKHFRGETMSIAEEKLLRNSQTAREVYETVSGMDYESGAYKDLASPAESVSSEVGNVQAETQTQQEAPAQTEQEAPKKKPSKKEIKHEEMLDQLDVRAAEKKAAQEAAARQEVETLAQPKQEAPQQAQNPAEVKSEARTKAPQKAPQQGTARKADRDTVKRAYKDFSNTSMKQSRFEALYNEAYNAESFEAFMKKHPSFGEKLKGAMQKAYENGHRAEIKAENSALFNDGLIMDEGDRYMLKSRKDIDSLIERYKKAAEDGVVPIETDSENYYDQFRELSAEESQKYSEAAAKLEKYRDEHFAADKKSVSTEKKPANTEEKTASTESSTDKKKKRIESVIRNLEMLKQKLENGDMAKLEQKNPDKYSEIMFKFEQQTADKNGSDYLGSVEDVSVLIDKYKTDLEMLEAENGAQTENIGAQTENAAKTQQISENAAKTQQNEYSPEYQNGAEHPETVGAMESDPMNITRAANESKVQPEKASTKNPFNDYDRYQSERKLTKADRNALERVVKNPVKGERTVWQETVDSVIDGDTYFEKDGNYYVKNEEGKTHRVAQSVFLFAEYLGKKGVRYTLNQTAEVPKEIGGRSVSKSVATALASRIGTNEFVEKIAANMEARDNRNAGLTYFKKKHSEVINWAKNYIEANGAEKAYAEFERAADGKTKYDAEHNVLGLMMCEMLSDINTSEANDLSTRIYAMIAANQTNAGQVSESMKMLKTLDRTNFTAFYEQLTQTLNQKHEKQLDGKKIILDDKLLKKAKESVGTENEARATLDLNRDIANQIPASGWDKINAVRYFCMLSSPITAIKNFFSNAVQLAMVKQKNVWLYLFERGFKKKHGDYVLTTSLTKDKEVSKYAGKVFNGEKNSETKYKEGSFAEINRTNTMRSLPGKLNKFSKYNLPGWLLDKIFSVPTTILNKTDIFFEKQLFKDRFSQVAKANNWSAEFLSDKASAKAVQAYTQAAAVSMEEALKGTYNNESSIANFINKWKSMPTNTFSEKAKKYAVGLLVETMAPFKKVPVNIAASAFNYSPAGLVFALSDLKSASKGDVDARSVLERCAKGMTGTTITIGGAILSMLGLLTIGRDSDEDKPDDEKKDNTMYLKIQDEENGDLYISIDWIDSISMQLRSGIGLKELFENTVENVKSDMNATEIIANFLSDVFSFTSKGIDSFMEQGMLQTIQSLIFNKSYANDMFDVLGNSAEKFATQFIPRVVVNARESADKEKRSTYYSDKTSNYPKWVQHIINQYIAAYGDREKLPARLDEWGNSLGEENDTKRFIESFISPGKWYRENDDEVQKMLDQLDTQVDANVFPSSYPTEITINGEKIALSGKEYEEVARNIGKERYKLLDELRKDREFQKLSPDKKAELIQDCYNIANEMAKYGFDDDYSISRITQDVKDAKEEKLSIPKYLRAKQAYDNMSEYEKDGVKISRSYQLADYLMNDTSTTVEEDIKIIELIERKKDGDEYKSPFENIRKVPNTSDEEMLSLYVAFRDQADKEEDLQSYMLEYGYNAEQALARYNVGNGSKTKYDDLGSTQKKKADKLLAAADKGRTANEWNEDKIALAASAVTSIGSFGTKKTLKSYIAMLMAVGFTESEAKEFYKYYA